MSGTLTTDSRLDTLSPKRVTPLSPAKHRQPQFSLAMLFVWMAYFALCFGSWGWAGGADGRGPALVPSYLIAGLLIATRGAMLRGVAVGGLAIGIPAGLLLLLLFGVEARPVESWYITASFCGWLGGGIHALGRRYFVAGALALTPLWLLVLILLFVAPPFGLFVVYLIVAACLAVAEGNKRPLAESARETRSSGFRSRQ